MWRLNLSWKLFFFRNLIGWVLKLLEIYGIIILILVKIFIKIGKMKCKFLLFLFLVFIIVCRDELKIYNYNDDLIEEIDVDYINY